MNKDTDIILKTKEISEKGFDIATHFKDIENQHIYVLGKSKWEARHKYGIFLAVVENGKARILNDVETICAFCS